MTSSGRMTRRESLLVIEDQDSMRQAMLSVLEKVKKQTVETIFEDELLDGLNTFQNFEDQMFDCLSRGNKKTVSLSQLLTFLEVQGIKRDDPRLNLTMSKLKQEQVRLASKGKDVLLDRNTFKSCINPNAVLIKKVFENDLVIPDFSGFTSVVSQLCEECTRNTQGKVTGNIPQLARASSKSWGVTICTIDGQRFSYGDSKVPFSLQSVCKALNYGLALSELQSEVVHKYVGQEPSGDQFNEIKLNPINQPHNPMINAGAIVVASLLRNSESIADRYVHVSSVYKKLAGNGFIGYNMSLFLSEREACYKDYALGHYMQENKCFPPGQKLRDTLDLYFQLCSVEVTCESGAVIAATLANGGICPMTGEEVLTPQSVRDTLALMHSCGLYDYSGQFAFKVGLPAKSGPSGVVLLVVPNVMGLCLWSPPLDNWGNSARAIQFCELLVSKFNFHQFDNQRTRVSEKVDPRKTVKHKEINTDQVQYMCIYAASKGNLKELKRIFLSGVDMGLMDYDGRTPLHLAAGEGYLDCVKFLLEICHVEPKPKDRWGHTPLEDAQTNEHTDIAEYLRRYTN